MRDISLFLKILSTHVYAANLRDSTDFREWLFKLSEVAGRSATMQEFFDRLP